MIIRMAGVVALVGVGWLVLLAAVMRLSGDAPAALVPLPSQAFLAALPPDVAVIGGGRFTVTLISPRPDLVAQLYRSGALAVLPAGLKGCTG